MRSFMTLYWWKLRELWAVPIAAPAATLLVWAAFGLLGTRSLRMLPAVTVPVILVFAGALASTGFAGLRPQGLAFYLNRPVGTLVPWLAHLAALLSAWAASIATTATAAALLGGADWLAAPALAIWGILSFGLAIFGLLHLAGLAWEPRTAVVDMIVVGLAVGLALTSWLPRLLASVILVPNQVMVAFAVTVAIICLAAGAASLNRGRTEPSVRTRVRLALLSLSLLAVSAVGEAVSRWPDYAPLAQLRIMRIDAAPSGDWGLVTGLPPWPWRTRHVVANLRTGASLRERPFFCAFSPDGRRAVAGTHRSVLLLDLDQRIKRTREVRSSGTSKDGVYRAVWEPDSRHVLLVSQTRLTWLEFGSARLVRQWAVPKGQELLNLAIDSSGTAHVATTTSDAARPGVRLSLWEWLPASPSPAQTGEIHRSGRSDNVVLMSAERIVLGSRHNQVSRLEMRDVRSGELVSDLGPARISSASFLQDGRLAYITAGQLRVIDTRGDVAWSLPLEASSGSMAHNEPASGRLLVGVRSDPPAILVVDKTTGRVLRTLNGFEPAAREFRFVAPRLAPGGAGSRLLRDVTRDRFVWIDPESGQVTGEVSLGRRSTAAR